MITVRLLAAYRDVTAPEPVIGGYDRICSLAWS